MRAQALLAGLVGAAMSLMIGVAPPPSEALAVAKRDQICRLEKHGGVWIRVCQDIIWGGDE
jgi:hypothetical protein